MAINFTKFYNGLNVVPQNTTDPDAPGDIRYNSGSNKLEIVDGSGRSSVVTESGSVSLTNKSIDATQNTIQNLTFSNFGPSDIPARRDLSNLQTTAINLSLIPSANDSINLGSVSNEWLNIYGQNILSTNLANMVVGTSDTQSGFLFQGSTTKLNTSRAPIAMGAQKITGLADPTAAQDAATKTYVDTGLSGKQATGNYITALTGDVTASGPGSAASTLATVNASPGTFTNATITVNAKGLVTSASGGTTAVTAVSVASANGFAGTSSGGATPALTLSTTVTGVLKGDGTSISAATPGTDYSAGTSALATGILRSTTATGALSIAVAGDFPTLNQNTTGTAANITATSNATLTTLSSLSLPTSQLTGTLAAGQFPALTGDITTTAGSLATTLATVNANVGSFGSSTAIPNFTVNAKGLITAAGTTAVVAPAGTLSGTTLNATVTGSSLTSVGTITAGTWNGTAIAILRGGTGQTTAAAGFNALSPVTTTGDLIIGNGVNSSTRLAIGTNGFVLTSNGTTATWAANAAAAPVTTKGDLFTFSTVNARLPVGSDARALVADSSTATGLRWTTTPNFGIKNYFTYNDFENAATTGWSLGTVGTLTNAIPTGTPTFGSGAAGTLAITTVASGQLAGTNSLSYASSVATTVGNMLASQAYTIDIEDQAKVLTWKFSYSPTVGASTANWSGTNSASFGVAIWDVTNSVWLNSTANFAMTQSSGVGIASGTVQTGATTASLRFVIYNANATSGAITVLFDSFSLTQQTAPIGAALTDWQSYTPTYNGFGTPTGVEAFWRRVGSDVEIDVKFIAGTTTAVEGRVSLPSGLTSASSARIPSIRLAGIAEINTLGAAGQNVGVSYATLIEPSVTYITFSSRSSGNTGLTKLNGSSIASSGNAITIRTLIPISGWSSNVQMSSDTDTRVISFWGRKTLSEAVTADVTNIAFTTQADSAGAWNGTQYVVPIAGDYAVTASIQDSASTQVRPDFYVNGTRRVFGTLSIAGQPVNSSALLTRLVPGDLISVRSNATSTLLGSGASGSGFTIFRLSGPATIAATESVNCRYTASASTTIAASGVTTIINYATRVFDSHNAFTTGASSRFTAPVSGTYAVNAGVGLDTPGASILTRLLIFKNNGGSPISFTQRATTAAGESAYMTISDLVYLAAGDFVDIRASNSNGSTTTTTSTNAATAVFVSINRIGN